MIKVLHLISGGDTGGAKTHIFSLMKGLKGLVDARIICFIKDSFYEEAVEKGFSIKVFPQKKRSDMSVVKKLRDEIKKENFSIIHAHGARANFICMFLKKYVDIPFVTTVHSDYKLDFKDNFYKNLIFTNLNKIALKSFDYYITVSDSFKDMLRDRGFKKDKIFVLYNGIDNENIPYYVSKDEFLNRYKIDYNGEFIVGIAARLDKVKDLTTFIRGAREVLKENTDVIFLIAGEGEELSHLQKEAESFKNNIFFLGFVKDNYSFFNAIDLNVLTSISESFPYVILEASTMNLTSVATDVGGIDKIIFDDETGYKIKVSDYTALKGKILYLYNNRDKLEKLGENIHAYVNKNFSYKSMGETQFEIYKNILEEENEIN
ncbi:glycosyltransferase family 4 protein [uncultured Peptoniphilus sp.]|uniref:glycosyltransferase family 4 protein n=1 Tax=uncultured Peptoniphilus sp. TaxID=254354 RepID=UPI0028055CBB|nr:glycosyltransferase family 4 protein [uncultured Peptoniphilus sp.]